VRDCNEKRIKVTRSLICQKALILFAGKDDAPTASTGWLEKLMKRHHFSLRVPTTICQKPPADYADKIVNFILFVQRCRQKNG
jgi:hypothetical protein